MSVYGASYWYRFTVNCDDDDDDDDDDVIDIFRRMLQAKEGKAVQ